MGVDPPAPDGTGAPVVDAIADIERTLKPYLN